MVIDMVGFWFLVSLLSFCLGLGYKLISGEKFVLFSCFSFFRSMYVVAFELPVVLGFSI
jgi:hypothetical protein